MTNGVPVPHDVPWRRTLLSDACWVVAALLAALVVGVIVDLGFRRVPLGLVYKPAAERTLEPSLSINLVSLEEVKVMLADRDVMVLDARPRVFYELGHVPGALCLSREEFEQDFALLGSRLRSARGSILVYCSDDGCEDAAIVARRLSERGFAQVHVFPGGYAEWEAAGQPVEMP